MDRVRVIDVYPYRRIGDETEFLLLHRSHGKYCENQWRMVGGKQEVNETAWQAGMRELWEETRCRPIQYWSVPSINHFYEAAHDRIMLIPVFAAELAIKDEVYLNEEHDSFRWFSKQNAQKIVSWPEQSRLIGLIDQILCSGIVLDEWIIN